MDRQRSRFYRCGAGAARGAHNSEVTGSKPVAGTAHEAVQLVFPQYLKEKCFVPKVPILSQVCQLGVVGWNARTLQKHSLPILTLLAGSAQSAKPSLLLHRSPGWQSGTPGSLGAACLWECFSILVRGVGWGGGDGGGWRGADCAAAAAVGGNALPPRSRKIQSCSILSGKQILQFADVAQRQSA